MVYGRRPSCLARAAARTAVAEAKVLSVKPGAAVELRPAADEKTKLTGRVRSVAAVASDSQPDEPVAQFFERVCPPADQHQASCIIRE